MTKTSYTAITTLIVSLLIFVPTISYAETFVQSMLWGFVVGVFGRLVGVAGLAIDWGVNQYIVGFGTNFLTTGIGGAVDFLWVAVRDIFNITFIFGLVFIGFKMILNSDDSSTRKWLVSLIMAAILVNFSLYITKSVVDFSNITATQIARAFPTKADGSISISRSFMDTFGIQGILNTGESKVPEGQTDGAAYAYIFGAMILFIVTAFVFAAGAIMIFIRFAALCLYMVLSPLMFLSWVFPQMQSVTSQYWHGFIGRALFAPVYLLLVYFSISIMGAWKTVLGAGGKNADYPAAFSAMGDITLKTFDATLPPFILGSIFMIAAVVVANKMGADGATTLMNIGKNVQNRAQRGLQRAAIRTTKSVAANTVGRGARRAAYATGKTLDKQISRMQNANKNSMAGRAARYVGNSVVMDDLRREGKAKLQNAKFGMKYTRDEEDARRTAINAQLNANDTTAAGNEARRQLDLQTNRAKLIEDGQKAQQRLTTETFTEQAGLEEREKLEAQVRKMQEAQNLPEFTTEEAKRLNDTIAQMQGTIGSLTTEQLERMFTDRTKDFAGIVGQLKGSQYDALASSKNFSQEQKNHLVELRTKALRSAVEKDGEIVMKELEKLTSKQLENLGDDFIRTNAHLLTQRQMDDLVKSDNLTDGQKGTYQGNRSAGMIAALKGPKLDEIFANRKPAEIANIPFEAYVDKDNSVNTAAISKIEAKHMEEIYKKLNPEQRNRLRDEIKKHGNASAKQYLDSYNGARNWNNTEALTRNQPPVPTPPAPPAPNPPLPPAPAGYEYVNGVLVPKQ